MNRYIDADFMQEKAYQMNFDRKISERELFLFNRALSEMPTVDAVPVVRCKDCTFHNEINCPQYYRRNELPNDWFCADGDRISDHDKY